MGRRLVAPPTPMQVSEWAEEYRILGSASSSKPGQWSNDQTPYLVEIMDRLSPLDPCEFVVFMKSTQIGGTEAGNNAIGYWMHRYPGPIMVLQPTHDKAKQWSQQRLDPLIETTPVLRGSVVEKRGRKAGNTHKEKVFAGGVMVITGGNSAAGLRQMPVRYLMVDDADGLPADADGEGDPLELALKRTDTFVGIRKVYIVSTPTTKDASRVEDHYLESDQRRFYVPCPECEHMQPLSWEGVTWKWPGCPGPEHARYQCRSCNATIPHYRKPWMLARGEWRSTLDTPDQFPWAKGSTGDPRIPGYHISALYSPWIPWGELATTFRKVSKDPPRLKVFVNTVLAETWDEADGDRFDGSKLSHRLEDWGDAAPDEVILITAGVDVQKDRLEVEVVGWGDGEESWSLGHFIIPGDPTEAPDEGVWADLHQLLRDRWDHASREDGMPIHAACVDTGGHWTAEVYKFCRRFRGHKVWAFKGRGGEGVDVWPKRPTRNTKEKMNLYVCGVDAAKSTIYKRLGIQEPGPGYCHFPIGRDEEWFRQLTVEVRKVRYTNGRPVRFWWKKDGARNEALDCRVMAYCALQGLYRKGKRLRPRGLDRPAPPQASSPTTPAAPTRPLIPPSANAWFDKRGNYF